MVLDAHRKRGKIVSRHTKHGCHKKIFTTEPHVNVHDHAAVIRGAFIPRCITCVGCRCAVIKLHQAFTPSHPRRTARFRTQKILV